MTSPKVKVTHHALDRAAIPDQAAILDQAVIPDQAAARLSQMATGIWPQREGLEPPQGCNVTFFKGHLLAPPNSLFYLDDTHSRTLMPRWLYQALTRKNSKNKAPSVQLFSSSKIMARRNRIILAILTMVLVTLGFRFISERSDLSFRSSLQISPYVWAVIIFLRSRPDESSLAPLPPRISIVVPTYKEVANIEPLCNAVFKGAVLKTSFNCFFPLCPLTIVLFFSRCSG